MEEGTLTGRWELIDGEILSKMGQNPPHRITLMLMKQWLKALFGFLNVQTEKPISIPGPAGRTNEPEPDIAVTTAPTTAYTDRHPAPQDLLLVVEVSDSTLRFDLTTKALLYAQVGIQEYWVADIEGRRLHCHRGPTPTGYSEVVVYEEAQQVSPLSRPDAPIGCGDLLPPQTV
jgi:Uma2 family endonuclease